MSEEEAGLSCHFLFILSLILITGRAITAKETPQSDKEVLLQLKDFLQKNNLIYRGGYAQWNESETSPCNWLGIGCSGDGRVTRVDLSASNISGAIFPSFSLLTELAFLDLSANTIGGRIPSDLNSCVNLRYLNLSHNLLDGELNLTGLNNLETLDLGINRFVGEIQSNFPAICENLVTLNISTNNLTGEITGRIDQCPKLQYLDLSSNQFYGEIWDGFSKLREFVASENLFTGKFSAESFRSDCGLEILDLSANSFDGVFPDSIANCSKLNHVSLWGNSFTGRVPSGIGSLSQLQTLILGKNSFDRDIPSELLNCSKLVFLDVSKNYFGGEIQQIFGQFTTLRNLVLHTNQYTSGMESSGIFKLPHLARLDLSYNNFTGNLPVQIADMPSLRYLILAYNNFNGSIPPEFGNITELQALDLSFNELTGSIPPTIGKLKSLLWLMLANNNLQGEIPREIGNCSSLLWLNLANNRLTGKIPPEISTIGSDPVPTFEINRRDSLIAGSGECLAMKRWIPASYPPFSFAYVLMTTKNCQFIWDQLLKGHGIFPMCLNSTSPFRTLTISGYLQLSGNQLSGEVPPEIGQMRNLSLVHLNINQLSSRLPPEIGRLPLVALNVSNNSFSGPIPPELGGIQCLQNLDLSCNNFSGEFPASLNRLADLSKFNVSFNPLLSGVIPVAGQIATFDNDSFLGDPLISFPNARANPSPTTGGRTSGHKSDSRKVAFYVFLALTVIFSFSGVLTFVLCVGFRSPVVDAIPDFPDPDVLLLDGVKRRSDVAESSSSMSTSEPSSTTSSDGIKVFRLDRTLITYDGIVTATANFSEDMVIGRGGYGVVYRGVLPDGRHVAVKKLQRGREGGGEKEFRAEMEVLAGRTGSGWPHPNLVALYGWCLVGSTKLLVYEFMEGGSLDEVISDWTRFGWARRLETAVGVARALVFLHHECRPAVVHRDVKAGNILLDRAGRARVTDFGLARVVGAGESHVSTVVAGTVGYVAPEYGHTWRATTRGDVYSFGVLAMELATGRRAVDGGEECLVEWTRRVAGEGCMALRRAMVPVMAAAAVEEEEEEVVEGLAEMCKLLRVGMRCTAEVPQARPDMRVVLAMLLSIYSNGGDAGGGGGGGGEG
ncbi:probable LRR receptor-like serine/threonine-protein kinase At1g74360 [Phoenix dactylifera]|uniref:non-specific serine/threonine protein kinase n=1 Tax=Phoenix dactylifera TaxID=42345 RepID=A0A8B9AJJ2_PHODC|nr:probable LRR receptor-like serine/threonine-protein kinase At1g74360 [Phoenix dactylifera]